MISILGDIAWIIEHINELPKNKKDALLAEIIIFSFIFVFTVLVFMLINYQAKDLEPVILFISLFVAYMPASYIYSKVVYPDNLNIQTLKRISKISDDELKIDNRDFIIMHLLEDSKIRDRFGTYLLTSNITLSLSIIVIWRCGWIFLYTPTHALMNNIVYILLIMFSPFLIMATIFSASSLHYLIFHKRYYVKGLDSDHSAIEGFLIDKNTLFNDGEIIYLPKLFEIKEIKSINDMCILLNINEQNEIEIYKKLLLLKLWYPNIIKKVYVDNIINLLESRSETPCSKIRKNREKERERLLREFKLINELLGDSISSKEFVDKLKAKRMELLNALQYSRKEHPTTNDREKEAADDE